MCAWSVSLKMDWNRKSLANRYSAVTGYPCTGTFSGLAQRKFGKGMESQVPFCMDRCHYIETVATPVEWNSMSVATDALQ